MGRAQALKIIGWWWGRVLPPSHEHLAKKSLCNLTNTELGTLDTLKDIYIEKLEKGEAVSWGRYTTKKEWDFTEKGDWYE